MRDNSLHEATNKMLWKLPELMCSLFMVGDDFSTHESRLKIHCENTCGYYSDYTMWIEDSLGFLFHSQKHINWESIF